VTYQEWTQDGVMRQPIYVGWLREDKPPRSVHRENPEPVSEALERDEQPKSKRPHQAGARALKKSRKKNTSAKRAPSDVRPTLTNLKATPKAI
jgi:hypothetical protein